MSNKRHETQIIPFNKIRKSKVGPNEPGELTVIGRPGETIHNYHKMVIISGKNFGYEFSFKKELIKIGRSEESDMKIPDRKVSRDHAVIEVKGDQCKLYDMKSKNGTRVNGKQIKNCLLQANDIIKIGRVKFKFIDKNQISSSSSFSENEYKKDTISKLEVFITLAVVIFVVLFLIVHYN